MDIVPKRKQPKANDTSPSKIVPLIAYGIKVYGREYESWPSRYNSTFKDVKDHWELQFSQTTRKFRELNRDAKEISQRAINIYQQSFSDRQTGGPAEDKWRMELEELVLGRFEHQPWREEGGREETPSVRQEFNRSFDSQSPPSKRRRTEGSAVQTEARRSQEFTPRVPSPFEALKISSPACQKPVARSRNAKDDRIFNPAASVLYIKTVAKSPGTNEDEAFDPKASIVYQKTVAKLPEANDQETRSDTSTQSLFQSTPLLFPWTLSGSAGPGSGHAQSLNSRQMNSLTSNNSKSSYASTTTDEVLQLQQFASAINRLVLSDDLGVHAPQPEQRPDRIIGLLPRKRPYANARGLVIDDIVHEKVRELQIFRKLNLSPFSSGDLGSMVLPFVVFEAKNAHGTYWPALERQAALPVAKFLRLQIKLQEATGRAPGDCNTLVWMFGSIGPEWHIYGCYAVWYRQEEEWRYKMVELARVDTRVQIEAISLLAIVDYVLKWAQRYRAEVIADMKKLEIVTIDVG